MTRRTIFALALVLLFMLTLEVKSSLQESQSYDEAVHLSAGLSYWRTGDYRMNPEHPPLIKLLASMPLVFSRAILPIHDQSWSEIDEWRFGEIFLYQNTLSPETLLLLGRLPIMLLSLLLGVLIFKVSRELFGPVSGWVALSLYAADPSIIAHSRFVTTDLGFALLAFVTLLRLDVVLRNPTKLNAFWFGLAFWGAGMAKFSGAALLVSLVFVVIAVKVLSPKNVALQFRTVSKFLLLAIPLSWILTWSLYGFDVRSPNSDPRVARLETERTQALQTTPVEDMPTLQRFAITVLGDSSHGIGAWLDGLRQKSYPTYTFFRGLTAVVSHATGGHGSFLLGQHSETGWWYYFPIAIVAKTPLPTIVALVGSALAFVFAFRKFRLSGGSWLAAYRRLDQQLVIFTVMPATFLAITMLGHLNLGWRHIMPIYPPLLVLASGVVSLQISKKRRATTLLAGLLIVGMSVAGLSAYPNFMGYFSPLVGGPRNGPNILQDSNLDWGQDLPKLAAYVQKNNLTTLPFSYYGRGYVKYYVPEATDLPNFDMVSQSGIPRTVVAISIGSLYDPSGSYRWLWPRQPIKKIGSSILVYDLR